MSLVSIGSMVGRCPTADGRTRGSRHVKVVVGCADIPTAGIGVWVVRPTLCGDEVVFPFTREDWRRGGRTPHALGMGLTAERVTGMLDRCVFMRGNGDIATGRDVVRHIDEVGEVRECNGWCEGRGN